MKNIGKITFTVAMDDAGSVSIMSSRELEPEYELLASRLMLHEQSIVKDATDNAASLVGKILRYIARPDKRTLTNKRFGG